MIRIVTDTTSTLKRDEALELGIDIVPQIVIFGDKRFRDDTEITLPQFLEMRQTDPNFPTTEPTPPEYFHPIFEDAAKQGDTVICIHPSSRVSATIKSAQAASLEFPGADIRIVDTRTIAGNLGTLVRQAKRWITEGLTADKVISNLYRLIASQRVYFVIDSMDALYRGGRVDRARAFVGDMLQIKPILSFNDGEVSLYELARTKRRALARLAEIAIEQAPQGDRSRICIMATISKEDADWVAQEIKAGLNTTAVMLNVSPATIVHTGVGGVGIGFFTADMI
jgi:DegV family protein with EDD domain